MWRSTNEAQNKFSLALISVQSHRQKPACTCVLTLNEVGGCAYLQVPGVDGEVRIEGIMAIWWLIPYTTGMQAVPRSSQCAPYPVITTLTLCKDDLFIAHLTIIYMCVVICRQNLVLKQNYPNRCVAIWLSLGWWRITWAPRVKVTATNPNSDIAIQYTIQRLLCFYSFLLCLIALCHFKLRYMRQICIYYCILSFKIIIVIHPITKQTPSKQYYNAIHVMSLWCYNMVHCDVIMQFHCFVIILLCYHCLE